MVAIETLEVMLMEGTHLQQIKSQCTRAQRRTRTNRILGTEHMLTRINLAASSIYSGIEGRPYGYIEQQ